MSSMFKLQEFMESLIKEVKENGDLDGLLLTGIVINNLLTGIVINNLMSYNSSGKN